MPMTPNERLVTSQPRPRVVHTMEVCFRPTETFIFEFVRGCEQYEAWCLADKLTPQPGWDCERVRSVSIGRREAPFWALASRLSRSLHGIHNLRLHRMLKRLRPTVVHAHFGTAGCRVRPYTERLRMPLLTSFYGFDASVLPRDPKWQQEFRLLFKSGAAFIAEGPAMARRLESIGCPVEKIHVLPITINVQSYEFVPRQLASSEKLRLLFVGRFTPKKGLAVLLPAIARARDRLGLFELRIVGSGDQESDVRKWTSELGLGECVHFLGFKSRSDMLEEMRAAHVLVVPSVTGPDGDSEGGAPTILLEAQATGLPVLCSDHADISFVIASDYRRFLSAEGSVEQFADQLIALRSESRRWGEFAVAGRAHVEQQHGVGNFEMLERLYDRTGVFGKNCH